MEHYRSTLATTAAAVFGLIAAAHILHPGNYAAQPRPARAPAAQTAWVDPPVTARVAAIPPAPAADAASGVARILAPEMSAALPPGAIMAPTVSGALTPQPERARKATAAHRRKVAQRGARTRQASLDRGAAVAPAEAQRADAPAARPRIDPIGDLMRGLGLGGEG